MSKGVSEVQNPGTAARLEPIRQVMSIEKSNPVKLVEAKRKVALRKRPGKEVEIAKKMDNRVAEQTHQDQ